VNLPRLRAALKYDKVEWERHVLERLVSRDISRSTECIEDYPDDYPFPAVFSLVGMELNRCT